MADSSAPSRRHVAEIVRSEWSRIVATLVARFGDLSDAEDAAQDAAEQALHDWPRSGLPDEPRAWLTVVARRRLIDRARRDAVGREKYAIAARLDADDRGDRDLDDELDTSSMRDEQLQLIFGCCHPALSREAQVALTLRSVGGLTTSQIAAAFLEPEPTIAQRLVRAKRKIRAAAIPFRIPPDAELLSRTDLVRTVIYLVFNEGYDASSGDEHMRVDLCDEAIRLADLLVELTPDDPESLGLVALFLLIHSRRDARVEDDGLVLLADQDRGQWDTTMIERGTATLDRALRLDRPGPFQIQAAINALHVEARTAADTDWEQIELLYRQLVARSPTPVVELNHAVAVAMTRGPAAGLARLDAPALTDALADYSHFHAARGHLLAELDDRGAASAAYTRALDVARNDLERSFLAERLATVSAPPGR
ncbi:RNA polymerase sigma factor [Ilumatobacter sp.]|uniref:RNA polymerase sigma factor n=1 Tax=Ilumatobacter sp. TaxID=1967498 RepID=UPI003C65842A